MERSTIRYYGYYWYVIPVLLVFGVFISGYLDPNGFVFFILAAVFPLIAKSKGFRLTLLDSAVILLWVYEIILLFTSINRIAGYFYLKSTTIALLFYFVLRLGFTNRKRINALLFPSGLYVGFLAFVSAVSFFIFESRMTAGGFTDLYDFRYVYTPMGNLTNVWSNILIGFLGIILLGMFYARKKQRFFLVLSLIPVIFGLVVSFSRGIYISLCLMLLFTGVFLAVSKKIKKGTKIAILATVVIGVALMAIPYSTEVSRTLEMNKSISQQRSIAGRLKVAEVAQEIVSENPLVGIGSGTYSLYANQLVYENDPGSFTHIAASMIFQVVAEKGLIGALLWVFLMVALLYTIISGKKKNDIPIFVLLILITLFIRELTFPVLLDHISLQIAFMVLLAIFQNNLENKRAMDIRPDMVRVLRWFPLVIWLLFFIPDQFIRQDKQWNRKVLMAVEAGDFEEAESNIEHTRRTLPYLINRSSICWKGFLRTGNPDYLDRAENDLRESLSKNPLDFQLRHNLAIVLKEKRKTSESLEILKGLTDSFPGNPLYNVSLFEFYRDEGAMDQGVPYLGKALLLSPSLLDAPIFKETVRRYPKTDSIMRSYIQSAVDVPGNIDNPIDKAEHARLILYLGDTLQAKSFFQEVSADMPNLPRPWGYLGMIAFESGDTATGRKLLQASRAIWPADPLINTYWTKYTGETTEEIEALGRDHAHIHLYITYFKKYNRWYWDFPVMFDDMTGYRYRYSPAGDSNEDSI